MVEHLYIHVPFCHRICPYCSFYKHTFGNINQSELVQSTLNEISIRNDFYDFNIKTIYLGGGTPTALSRKNLESLLSGINQIVNLKSLEEWGIEVNPSTCNLKKAQMIKDHGVTRTSLGIQSWNESTLKKLGRDHSPSDAEKSFEILKSCEFNSLNIDLMFSIPGQSVASWEDDLNKTIKLGPNHISAYNLNYEEDTEFFERLKKGEFYEDPEKDGDHFSLAMETLIGSGYEHYEISNFSRNKFISKHNTNYWNRTHYLGIGPSAHSFNGFSRQWNINNNNLYSKYIMENTPHFSMELLSEKDIVNEYILTKIRGNTGINLDYLEMKMSRSDFIKLNKEISKLIKINLMCQIDNNFKLTLSGMLMADKITSDLFII